MKHITLQADDLPRAPFLMERRLTRDRRALWRGGRRDSDWTERPPGAWARMSGTPQTWKRMLATLHLW